MQEAVSEWPTAARRRGFRGGYHGAWLTRPAWRCRARAERRYSGAIV